MTKQIQGEEKSVLLSFFFLLLSTTGYKARAARGGAGSSNRACILAHGVSGVEWKHYKHPLPEHAYDTYMPYWKDVRF